MIKEFLESLEDPTRPLLAPNFWWLKKNGFILPKNPLARKLIIFIHEVATFFVFTEFLELYIIRSDIDLILTNMKISMLSAVCICKVHSFLIWKDNWKKVIDYVTGADIFERNTLDVETQSIVEAYTKYSRRVTYSYWLLVLTTSGLTVLQPAIWYMTSPSLREGYRNGTARFPHIFSSWMPFDKEHSPGCWATVAWHAAICAYGASTMVAYDTTVVTIMVFFGGKLDILRLKCNKMLGPGITDADSDAVVKELYHIHVELLKHSRLFNSMLSPLMFFYTVVCSLMLCASAYQLTRILKYLLIMLYNTQSTSDFSMKVYMVEYLTFGIAQLFIFCWHSNNVLLKSENMHLGPYESEWWTASLRQRKNLLLLTGQLRMRNIFSAGPFADLTLATFITILKGAYSYYTLISNESH